MKKMVSFMQKKLSIPCTENKKNNSHARVSQVDSIMKNVSKLKQRISAW